MPLPVRRLETPTPYAVGPVNSYLIEVEPYTLIDSGISTPEAETRLFDLLGDDVQRIQRVLVTHGHPDHYGLMHAVAQRSGASIHFPQRELVRLTSKGLLEEWGKLLLAQGMPMELLLEMDEHRRRDPRPRVQVEEVTPIMDGDSFEFDGLVLEAHHNPGHTGGHMVFFEPQSRVLLAGDQLLPNVSPNPLLEPSFGPEEVERSSPDGRVRRRRSLREYLDSLEALAKLDPVVAYPGHGDPVAEPAALVERTREHHIKRKRRIERALGARRLTPFELALELYPNVRGYDVFLAVSEVVAHLDLVEEDGRATSEERDGVVCYRSSGAA